MVKNAPAYSCIKRRRYDIANPEIEEIIVELKTLDEVIPPKENIHFIKIDVEGGEYGVLKGAKNILQKYKPILLFECGKGASDFYGTKPLELFEFISNEIGLNVFTLESFVDGNEAMSSNAFENYFNSNKEYYFVASSKSLS